MFFYDDLVPFRLLVLLPIYWRFCAYAVNSVWKGRASPIYSTHEHKKRPRQERCGFHVIEQLCWWFLPTKGQNLLYREIKQMQRSISTVHTSVSEENLWTPRKRTTKEQNMFCLHLPWWGFPEKFTKFGHLTASCWLMNLRVYQKSGSKRKCTCISRSRPIFVDSIILERSPGYHT